MKQLFTILTLISLSLFAKAQQNEFGFWGGFSNYFGDLNTQTSFRYIHPAGGLYYRYNYDSRLSAKMQVSYGKIEANDATADNYYQRTRNLSFFSNVFDLSLTGEFNFLDYNSSNPKFFYTPYVCLGASVFSFDPKTRYNGNVYSLRPIGTEGQGLPQYPDKKRYKTVSTAFVVGGGFKLRLNKNISTFLEISNHKARTDYLDDVSGTYPARQVLENEGGPLLANLSDRSLDRIASSGNKRRGDSKKKDDYLFVGVGISFTIITYKCPYNQ